MSEDELVGALVKHCPPLRPSPVVGFDGQYQGEHDPRRNDRASVTNQEALILADLAEGKRVLEIGTGLGVSTVALAHKAHSVVTVDPDEWVRGNVDAGTAVHMVASLADTDGPFDLAFIDGLHDIESVRRDIEGALRLVKPGGMIAFHDLGQSEVAAAVNSFEWAHRASYETLGSLLVCTVPA